MKIAMIGHKRIPSREGGVEIVVEELAVRMAAKGCEVHAYNRAGRHVGNQSLDPRQEQKTYQGVRLIRVPTIPKRGIDAFLYSFFATVRALFSGYDVIHYHAEGPCAMLPIAHFFGLKTVATIHGLDWQRSKWGGFATRYLKFGERSAARWADHLTVLSANMQRYFTEQYNRSSHLIRNGVSAPQYLPPDFITAEYGLKGDDYVLFLARIVPEKGLHYLLTAYRELDTNIRLVVAGGASHSEEYMDEMKRMAQKDSRVIMTGFVEGEVLWELMGNCRVFVLPSDVEGMPLGLLEAMSFGRRCLVSDIPENTEVVGPYAQSFRKGDVDDLKQKLAEMLKEPSQPQQAQEIQNHVLQKYSWDGVTEQYMELYQN